MVNIFFFFSSRRRHTRFDCDWSSDVCSSDLPWRPQPPCQVRHQPQAEQGAQQRRQQERPLRSEERRVGKSVDLGGRRIIKKKKKKKKKRQVYEQHTNEEDIKMMTDTHVGRVH